MTITAYTTENIKTDTLAAGIAVMSALQSGGTEGFASHPATADAVQTDENTFRFTPDLDRISSPMALVLDKAGAEIKITLPADGTAKTVLHKALSGKTGSSGGATPKDPAPK